MLAFLSNINPLLFAPRGWRCLRKLVPGSPWIPLRASALDLSTSTDLSVTGMLKEYGGIVFVMKDNRVKLEYRQILNL